MENFGVEIKDYDMLLDDIYESYDLKIKAYCEECDTELGIGDYVDSGFPFHSEENICLECKKRREGYGHSN